MRTLFLASFVVLGLGLARCSCGAGPPAIAPDDQAAELEDEAAPLVDRHPRPPFKRRDMAAHDLAEQLDAAAPADMGPDLSPACHALGEACPPIGLPPPAPKYCCAPTICLRAADGLWRCATP